jgi:hypothetical protein
MAIRCHTVLEISFNDCHTRVVAEAVRVAVARDRSTGRQGGGHQGLAQSTRKWARQ